MNFLSLKAYAKINWALDITGRREDGYHLIDSLMQHISLFDEISILRKKEEIRLECAPPDVPLGPDNIAWKAAALFFQHTGITEGCLIKLQKNIPSCAGLGGGSADAAGVLQGLNILHGSPLSPETLTQLALSLGADVPYMLQDFPARARGIGEKLESLSPLENFHLLCAKPSAGASTKEIFALYDNTEKINTPQTEAMATALQKGDFERIAAYMGNVLQPVTEILLPQVAALRRQILELGAEAAAMTGSGSCVFGVFSSEKAAHAAAQALPWEYWKAVVTTCNKGIEILEMH